MFILIGNLIGVALSMSEQDADKERLTTAMLHIKCRWEVLSTKNLNKEEQEEYNNMQSIRTWVKSWVQEDQISDLQNKKYSPQITF